MAIINKENVEDVFTYHAPDEQQRAAYAIIRATALQLATAILEATPACADQQAALRKLRESVMTANAAVALKGAI